MILDPNYDDRIDIINSGGGQLGSVKDLIKQAIYCYMHLIGKQQYCFNVIKKHSNIPL